MLSLIGNPRALYSSECQNPTNPRVSAKMVTADISRLKVTGLDSAVQSLNFKGIFSAFYQVDDS